MGLSGQHHASVAIYPRKRTPGTHWMGGWVGFRVGLGTEATTLKELSFASACDRTPVVYTVVGILTEQPQFLEVYRSKTKQSRYTPWWCLGWEEYSSYSFFTSALDGVIGQRHAPAALCSGERTPGTHCTGGWVGLRAGLDTEARGKIICLCRGSNLYCPVVLYVVRQYTDWATPEVYRTKW
jgi:hypothetical protein